MKTPDCLAIGPLQLEILHLLWDYPTGVTVRELELYLNAKRTTPLAYTTCLTVVRNLEKYKYARHEKSPGGQFVFFPLMKKAKFLDQVVSSLTAQFFRGDVAELKKRLA